jgi:hypothetical protein
VQSTARSRSIRSSRVPWSHRCPWSCANGGAGLLIAVLTLAGCVEQEPLPVAARRQPSLVLEQTLRVSLGAKPALGAQAGQVVVKGSWGHGSGQFGKRDEASRPGPMSLAVGVEGELYVLDQVNRRVQRYSRSGALLGSVALESETAEDLVVTGADLWVLFYEPGTVPGHRLRRYSPTAATPTLELRVDGLEGVTGLFAGGKSWAPDLWIEVAHENQVQVIAGGKPVLPARRAVALGRLDPSQPGTRLLASRGGPALAVVDRVYPGRFTARLLEVETSQPVEVVDDLGVDAAGGLYLSMRIGDDSGLRHVLLARRGSSSIDIELASTHATDLNRSIAVGRDGAVHQLETTEEGVTVRRWTPAGEGRRGAPKAGQGGAQ